MAVDLTGAMLRRLKPGQFDPTNPVAQIAGRQSAPDQFGVMQTGQTPAAQTQAQTPAPPPANVIQPYVPSTNDYDYDPEYDTTIRQLTARQNFLNSQYTQGRNQLNTAYQMPLQDLENQHGTDLQSLAAQMAQQGILRSSNNLYSQGRLNDAYQRQYGGLLSQRQQQQETLDRQRAQSMQDILEEQINALGKHTQYVGEKEKERAGLEAQAAAAEEGRKRQEELAKQLAQQAAEAQQAFQQLVTPPPPTQTTPTGAIVPAQIPQQTVDSQRQAYDWGGSAGSFSDPWAGSWDDRRYRW